MVNHVAKKHRLSIFDNQRFQIAKKKKKKYFEHNNNKTSKRNQGKISYPIFELIMCIFFLKCFILFGIFSIQNQFNRALNFFSYSWKKKQLFCILCVQMFFPERKFFFFCFLFLEFGYFKRSSLFPSFKGENFNFQMNFSPVIFFF